MDLAIAPITVTSPAKVPAVRHKIRRFAAAVLDDDRVFDVEVMLGEAVANALIHGHGDPVVTVTCTEKALRIEVHDHGPALLVARRVDHGRGLAIVNGLAARWAMETSSTETCVWFEVDRPASK